MIKQDGPKLISYIYIYIYKLLIFTCHLDLVIIFVLCCALHVGEL